ncbi:hypothetical protein HY643_05090, partial [Candidatus Woesearchaeota archaeon]|nr:hypothetical protein [Candidatus Woesearchaeota archaeon]
MGLDKIFQEKAEKPVEEKKLEVITSDKYVLGEWMAYFESISEKMGVFSEADFLRAQKFFQSFQTSPKLINKFNRKFNRKNKE